MKQAWITEGEKKFTTKFFKGYIDDNNFNMWHVNCSGLTGCLPTNNPQECVNLECKGTNKIHGLSKIGLEMLPMLTEEFPEMIHTLSITRTGVQQQLKINELKVVTQHNS